MTDTRTDQQDNRQGDAGNIEYIEYDKAMQLVQGEMSKALTSSPSIIRQYTAHLNTSGGKMIRALSVLTCALNGEGRVHPNAVKLAAAIELFHLATLVHDDVIDDAGTRRGAVTLQRKYGKRTAVICGDYIFCIALKLAGDITGKGDYLNLDMPDYIGRVCLGELNQHIHNGVFDLSVHQYFRIISGKTAALFEASFYAGAVLDGREGTDLKRYGRLGRYIGMIFQITDDCMDFEATEKTSGKPVQSDYEQGVITLPLIYAFKRLAGFKEKAGSTGLSRSDVNQAVAEAGGLQYARKVTRGYYNKALQIIDRLDAAEEKKARLRSILDKACRVS